MNYLAHLYLAEDTPESLVGNVAADCVKGRIPETLAGGIRRGIALHRKVDAFTDAHPVVRDSRRRVSPENRRYAGILVDLFYDHLLARHWPDYSPVPLPRFAERVYGVLSRHETLLPPAFLPRSRRMIWEDWLVSYAQVEGIGRALERLSRHIPRENRLAGAAAELTADYAGFTADFRAFFPELVAHVEALR